MYHRILVPLDGSATAERGLREAIGLAAEQKARLSLLHVADNFPMLMEMSSVTSYQEMLNELRRYGEDVLAKAKRAAAEAGVQADTLLREVTQGRIADVIIDEAKKTGCGLIVMGTHGRRGFSRLTLGSEAERVVRSSTVPVLLVRLDEPAS
jgi:nucleotide-binding universal stress UspA family protein